MCSRSCISRGKSQDTTSYLSVPKFTFLILCYTGCPAQLVLPSQLNEDQSSPLHSILSSSKLFLAHHLISPWDIIISSFSSEACHECKGKWQEQILQQRIQLSFPQMQNSEIPMTCRTKKSLELAMCRANLCGPEFKQEKTFPFSSCDSQKLDLMQSPQC